MTSPCNSELQKAVPLAVQAADLRQQALQAVQADRRVQSQLGRDISLGPGG